MSYQEPNIEMDCHYPEVLQAYLYVMPAQIDDPRISSSENSAAAQRIKIGNSINIMTTIIP